MSSTFRYPNDNRPTADVPVYHWKYGSRNLATVSGLPVVNGIYVYNDIDGDVAWELKYNDNKPEGDELTTPFNTLDENVAAWNAGITYSVGDVVGPETVGNDTQKYYKLIASAPKNTPVATVAKWAEIKTRYAIFKVDEAHVYYDAAQSNFVGKYIIWRFADVENGVDKKAMEYQNLLTQANIDATQGAFNPTTDYALNNIVGPEADGNYHKMIVNEAAGTPLSNPSWLLLGKEPLPENSDTGHVDDTEGVVQISWQDAHSTSTPNVPKNGVGWIGDNPSVDLFNFYRLEFSLDTLNDNTRTNFNFGSQNTPAPDTAVGEAGYYGNDNGGYYSNSNRDPDLSTPDVGPAGLQPPNSNVDLQNT